MNTYVEQGSVFYTSGGTYVVLEVFYDGRITLMNQDGVVFMTISELWSKVKDWTARGYKHA